MKNRSGKLSERVDQRVLSWYGQMVNIGEDCLTKKVWKADVSWVRVRRRTKKGLDRRGGESTGSKKFVC